MIKLAVGMFLVLGLVGCSSAGQMQQHALGDKLGVSNQLLDNAPDKKANSYAANPQVQAFITRLVEQDGFDKNALELAFSRIKIREKVIQKSDNQPEVITPYYEYSARFVNPQRIASGKAFAQKNKHWLLKAEKQYAVDWHVIVALIGVETYYGRITGSKDVFTSLTTLAFDYPRRQAYFQNELRAYLLLARENNWNIGATKGSYTGAMGMVQFMPTNYRKLAVDYDGDGHIDLWQSDADAIGSVANYLQHHGWEYNQPYWVMASVEDPDAITEWVNHDRKPIKTAAQWSALKVLPKQHFLNKKMGLVGLRTKADEVTYWLAYENFFTIMDYNPSRRYAMSVLALAENIGKND
ncbi:membrane-bound lytic murein transglycosylase B [Marinomonas pollencensis]|uniref:Membrane-bound lytic murein transglycosylase B n=2 Tax=Marinomonas pollencensis TaxID=491954 RepID=A0A3E0DMW2_9GAMM|nr:membrane-bound lytic murein transglycosylase B [Marinomonas pollencensis]